MISLPAFGGRTVEIIFESLRPPRAWNLGQTLSTHGMSQGSILVTGREVQVAAGSCWSSISLTACNWPWGIEQTTWHGAHRSITDGSGIAGRSLPLPGICAAVTPRDAGRVSGAAAGSGHGPKIGPGVLHWLIDNSTHDAHRGSVTK
jgi:hypothetical protein